MRTFINFIIEFLLGYAIAKAMLALFGSGVLGITITLVTIVIVTPIIKVCALIAYTVGAHALAMLMRNVSKRTTVARPLRCRTIEAE